MLSGCAKLAEPLLVRSDESDETLNFPAVIKRPDSDPIGAVLLIGGGYAHDEHWTVPGSYINDGETTPLTISGEPHTDAVFLSDALTSRGFVVMRYRLSGSPPGEPLMPVPIDRSIEIAREAMQALRAAEPVASERIVLVGHSLGALRAARIADAGVAGIVWLAPAYATAQPKNSVLAMEAAAQTLYDAADPHPEIDDFDGDGELDPWEITRWAIDAGLLGELPTTVASGTFPIDTVRELDIPLLALFGELDPITMHAPALSGEARCEVIVVKGLGHNLSEERGGLVGPITDETANVVAWWCEDIALNQPVAP